jgi:hypothetical protein
LFILSKEGTKEGRNKGGSRERGKEGEGKGEVLFVLHELFAIQIKDYFIYPSTWTFCATMGHHQSRTKKNK